MKRTVDPTVMILTLVLGLGLELTATAQPPTGVAPARESAQTPAAADDLEPAVATSPTNPAVAAPRDRSQSAHAAPAGPSATSDSAPSTPPLADRTAKAKSSKEESATGHTAGGKPASGGSSTDRLELGTTEISGNRELPKVLYVVPWRRPDPGDAVGRPPNSLVEEALTPVDRAVFQRQNHYYAALESSAGAAQPGAAAGGGGAPARAANHR